MNKLLALIETLESKIQYFDKRNTAISKSPVGWHIQHTLLTTRRIIKAIESSNPKSYEWKFNLTRNFVLTFNKIPRGKGKAPNSVIPNETLVPSELLIEIQELKAKINVLDTLHSNHYFDHPYFGHLNLKATRKFLEIHTKHHIAIIDDILN
jgi:hypothetical protein